MLTPRPLYPEYPPCPPTCPLCDGDPLWRTPYCVQEKVGGVTASQPREQSKAEVLAQYDARMAETLAKVPKVNPRGQSAASTPLETPRSAEDAECAAPTVRTESLSTATTAEECTATACSATASAFPAPRPKGRRHRKPRRSALQLQRAAEQEQREAAVRVERATRGTALEGALEEEERWAASLRDAET